MLPGQAQMEGPAPGVPPGSISTKENYAGPKTLKIGCCIGLFIGPCAVLFCIVSPFLCPLEEREVYVAPGGQRYLRQDEVNPNAWTPEIKKKPAVTGT